MPWRRWLDSQQRKGAPAAAAAATAAGDEFVLDEKAQSVTSKDGNQKYTLFDKVTTDAPRIGGLRRGIITAIALPLLGIHALGSGDFVCIAKRADLCIYYKMLHWGCDSVLTLSV